MVEWYFLKFQYYSPGGAIYDAKGNSVGFLSPYDVRNPWNKAYFPKPAKLTIPFELDANGIPIPIIEPAPPVGVNVQDYGVGTGVSEGRVSGKKTSFSIDEPLSIGWKLSGDVGGKTSTLVLYRKENGVWAQKWKDDYSASSSWTSFWHQVNIIKLWQGEWKVEFQLNGEVLKTILFTYGEIPEPALPEVEPIPPEPGHVRGKVTSFFPKIGIPLVAVKFSTYSTTTGAEGIYDLEVPAGFSGPITFTIPGYEPYSKNISAGPGLDVDLNVELNPIPIPEVTPFWRKAIDLLINPIELTKHFFGLEGLKNMWELWKIVDEKTRLIPPEDEDKFVILEFPLWFAMPNAVILEGVAAQGILGEPAVKLVAALKHQNFIRSLEWMKANPIKAAKDFPKLDNTLKAELLKGLRKDRLAVSFTKELESANYQFMKALDMGYWTKLTTALRDPKTMNYSIGRIAGLLAALAGTQFGLEWAVKEGIIEPMVFPYTQELSAYRFKPTPERRELIESMLKRMEGKIPKATAIMEALGWVFPPLKPLWDAIAETYDTQLIDFRKELEIIEEPEAVGTLIIRPIPEDAKVSVEGQIPSTGVFNMELVIGSYDYTISKFGFISKSGTAEVKADEETIIEGAEVTLEEEVEEVIPPEEIFGKLIISAIDSTGSAEGIVIEVAGQEEITTTGEYELTPGNYDVKASKEGFISQTKRAFVSEGKHTVLSFLLQEVEKPEELPSKATLRIISEPIGADIYIDGKYTFTKTPYTTILKAGTYILRVQKDGFYPQEISITLGEGDEIEVPFVLESIPPEVIPEEPYIPYDPWIPDYFPDIPYIPDLDITPYPEISLPDYGLLTPPVFGIAPVAEISRPIEKEIMINIETTGVYPWESRLFSIAYLDLTTPGAEIQVFVDNDEKKLLTEFMAEFEPGNYVKLLGFNVGFDHRFIFNKLMLHRMQSKKFKEIKMRDVKQLMDQVQEAFVYNAKKKGTLDNYSKELLGRGKLGKQEVLLKRYLAGDFQYVGDFQTRQIELTRDLYDLFRFSALEGFKIASSPIPAEETALPTALPAETGTAGAKKTCLNCKAYNPITANECEICGFKI